MVSVKPRSILQLTVIGFLSVTGLLVVALLLTSRQLDSLGEQNSELMTQSSTALGLGRTLTDLTTSLERNARQYNVLKDDAILRLYGERKAAFHATANELTSLNIDAGISSLVSDIRALEEQASSRLTEATAADIDQLYQEILVVSNRIASEISSWSNGKISEISAETAATQRLLTLQGLLLIVVALVLAAVFTALITRPLVQVEKAIEQLGGGFYTKEIEVNGPRDLVSLGKRLDWLRDRLAKLEQQRSSFLRHVSHDLKTPLTAIKESASLLEDGVVGALNEKQKNVVQIQLNNTRRLQQLIDELLHHHLASFSVLATMPSTIRMEELLKEVLSDHEMAIRSAGINIEKHLITSRVQGNREQIRVVIDNLLSNAVKFCPDGGTIDITFAIENRYLHIDIGDSGPGVDKEDIEHIFDAFYRGRQSESSRYGGSGLGLSIAQEYIEANQGRVELRHREQGACFRVSLPLESDRK